MFNKFANTKFLYEAPNLVVSGKYNSFINEITVLGSRCGQFGPALRLLDNKRIDFTPFISGSYSIENALEAFEANKSKDTLKILIKL